MAECTECQKHCHVSLSIIKKIVRNEGLMKLARFRILRPLMLNCDSLYNGSKVCKIKNVCMEKSCRIARTNIRNLSNHLAEQPHKFSGLNYCVKQFSNDCQLFLRFFFFFVMAAAFITVRTT